MPAQPTLLWHLSQTLLPFARKSFSVFRPHIWHRGILPPHRSYSIAVNWLSAPSPDSIEALYHSILSIFNHIFKNLSTFVELGCFQAVFWGIGSQDPFCPPKIFTLEVSGETFLLSSQTTAYKKVAAVEAFGEWGIGLYEAEDGVDLWLVGNPHLGKGDNRFPPIAPRVDNSSMGHENRIVLCETTAVSHGGPQLIGRPAAKLNAR